VNIDNFQDKTGYRIIAITSRATQICCWEGGHIRNGALILLSHESAMSTVNSTLHIRNEKAPANAPKIAKTALAKQG
jgi:hypothetical protein